MGKQYMVPREGTCSQCGETKTTRWYIDVCSTCYHRGLRERNRRTQALLMKQRDEALRGQG